MRKLFYLLFMGLLVVSCRDAENNPAAVSYKIFVPELSDRILNTSYPAVIRGRQSVEIRPQVSGTITEIKINDGDKVRKGQVLFVIDQVPYKAALETAKANVQTAKAKLQTARLNYSSKQELYKRNVVSEFDLQTAELACSEAEAALSLAQAQELNARNDLSYTEVKSPVDGVASMIPYRVGALVNSSITEPLVSVSDGSSVYAYFSMTESQIIDIIDEYGTLEKAIENMPEVELKMSNGKIYGQKGRIDAISGTVEQSTGAVSLRAVFSNEAGFLRDGGSGSVIVPVILENCLTIPQASTYEMQNRTFVYKVVDGYTKSSQVEVFRLNNGTEFIVESGLQPGDTIIAEGAGLLKNGIKIQ